MATVTVIVADRRVGVMAADSRLTTDGAPAGCVKLARIRGLVVGVAGESAPTLAMLRYFRSGETPEDPDELDDGYALALCPKRGILYFDQSVEPEVLDVQYFAIGSGAGPALGCLWKNGTVIEAVEAAIAHNVNCGPPVVSMTLQSAVRRKRRA